MSQQRDDDPITIEKPKKKKKRVKKPQVDNHFEDQPNIPAMTKDDIEIREDLSDNDNRLFSDDQTVIDKGRRPKAPTYDSDEGPNL
jgi:hypothetical protein